MALSSLESLPPFDAERDYMVPGATLEKLRLDWMMLKDRLASSQAALQEARQDLALAQGQLNGLKDPLAKLNQSLQISADSFKAYRSETSLEIWFWRGLALFGWGWTIYDHVIR